MKTVIEPVFTGQEQGVVYLFSRYWEKIPEFGKAKRVAHITTRFPDCTLKDVQTGNLEGVEFEYALSKFHNHLQEDVKRLNDEHPWLGKRAKALYIVYWDDDDDHASVRRKIRKHFHGKVIFVRLSKYFRPVITQEQDHLGASWEFALRKAIAEKYDFSKIANDTLRLEKGGCVKLHAPNRKLYRTIGFNKNKSDFIEWDHWKAIHLFTTSRFDAMKIPAKLFVKPTGYRTFVGYFEVRTAFHIKENRANHSSLKDYWRKYYFYRYHRDYCDHTCLVYRRFKTLRHEDGVRLFDYLKTKYALDIQGSPVITDSEHIRAIDRIISHMDA